MSSEAKVPVASPASAATEAAAGVNLILEYGVQCLATGRLRLGMPSSRLHALYLSPSFQASVLQRLAGCRSKCRA